MKTITRRTFLGALGATAAACALSTPTPALAKKTKAEKKKAEAEAARALLEEYQLALDQAADDYNAALEAYDAAVAAMDEAASQLEVLKERLCTRARSMYRTDRSSFLDVLLDATSFEEFIDTFDTLNALNESDAELIEETRAIREEYEAQSVVAAEQMEEAERAQAEAEELIAKQDEVIAGLDDEVAIEVKREQMRAMASATTKEEALALAAEVAADEKYAEASRNVTHDDGLVDRPEGDFSAVVPYAESKIGCPYVWASHGPDSFDCSGFSYWCYQQIGVYVSPVSRKYEDWEGRFPVEQARPGDILYRTVADGGSHVGIYIGDGICVHAATRELGVIYGNLTLWSYALHP